MGILSHRQYGAISLLRSGTIVIVAAAIVLAGMVLGFGLGGAMRRQKNRLLKEMMNPMRRGEDQKE